MIDLCILTALEGRAERQFGHLFNMHTLSVRNDILMVVVAPNDFYSRYIMHHAAFTVGDMISLKLTFPNKQFFIRIKTPEAVDYFSEMMNVKTLVRDGYPFIW